METEKLDIVSIAIVSQNDRELFLFNKECDFSKASPWVLENVLPTLNKNSQFGKTKQEIKETVLEFMGYPDFPSGKPIFYGFYSEFPWAPFVKLFGSLVNLPDGFPLDCYDINQLLMELGNPPLHNPYDMDDHPCSVARWVRKCYETLQQYLFSNFAF